MSIGYGEDVEVTQSMRDVFVSLCTELENDDLCCQIIDIMKLTCENVLSRLKMKRDAGLDYSAEIEFAASHLHEISQNDIEALDTTDLSNIILSSTLQIKSENWLDEVVKNFVSERGEGFWLFEYGESCGQVVEVACNHPNAQGRRLSWNDTRKADLRNNLGSFPPKLFRNPQEPQPHSKSRTTVNNYDLRQCRQIMLCFPSARP
jgi:hypothetical protein